MAGKRTRKGATASNSAEPDVPVDPEKTRAN